MRTAALLIVLIACAGVVSAYRTETVKALWQSWKLKHNKVYRLTEEAARFAIFADNVQYITKFNAEHDDVKLAIGKFADLSSEEFKRIYASGNLAKPHEGQKNYKKFNLTDPLPDNIDWKAKGAVTPVKDQGQCGSCWAFSATGAVEGFYFVNNGTLISFSEQQILDCDVGGEDQGCNGGWHYLAIGYAGKYGLEHETGYPYRASQGKCKYEAKYAVKTNKGYDYVMANSTDAMKTALLSGPVSVAIQADEKIFQHYSSGVISYGCGANLNHAVLITGYKKIGATGSFVVKNSWGSGWGDRGYVQLSTIQQLNRGMGACGVLALGIVVN